MHPVLSEVIAQIKKIAGDPHVIVNETDVKERSRDISLWDRLGAAIVYPGCAEEVAEIVKIANSSGISVWPFSKGKNWGYGATMPWRDGAIIMVLERLNRIIE